MQTKQNTTKGQSASQNRAPIIYTGKRKAAFYDADAIARLAAQRDELLEALKELVRAYCTIPDKDIGCYIAHRYDKAKAAIANVEGK